MTMDPTLRAQIVLGAVTAATAKLVALTAQAAGDTAELTRLPDLEALIAQSAAEITAAVDPKSTLSRLIDAVHGSKVFTAVITQVVKEQSSTRGLVTLRARPSQFHPDGIEQARTERTDSPEGLLMARTLRALTGHRVALWIEEQTTGDGARKVRVIQHVKDLGWADDDRDTAGAA
jgi:hypothetical protein